MRLRLVTIVLLFGIVPAPSRAGDPHGSATGGFLRPEAVPQGRRFGPPPQPETRHAPPPHRRHVPHVHVLWIEPLPFIPSVTPPGIAMYTSDGARTVVDLPFLCFVDKRGFAERHEFVRHLQDEHGVPPESAMVLSTVVGGDHIVFFGDSE